MLCHQTTFTRQLSSQRTRGGPVLAVPTFENERSSEFVRSFLEMAYSRNMRNIWRRDMSVLRLIHSVTKKETTVYLRTKSKGRCEHRRPNLRNKTNKCLSRAS
jgi:hypothetical protein